MMTIDGAWRAPQAQRRPAQLALMGLGVAALATLAVALTARR